MVDVNKRIPNEAAVLGLANNLSGPQLKALLEQSATDLAMLYQNTLIKDVGEVLVWLAANLTLITLARDMEDVLSRSVAGLRAAAACSDGAINDAIEHLTEQPTMFCFEHLEGSINVSEGNSSDEIDLNAESDIFDNELMVRDKHCCIGI